MEDIELIAIADLRPGDRILLKGEEKVEFRRGMRSGDGWVLMVVYPPDQVRLATLAGDVKVPRIPGTATL